MKKHLSISIFLITGICAGLFGQDINVTITDATGIYSQDGKIKAKVDPSYNAGPYVFTWAGQAIIPPVAFFFVNTNYGEAHRNFFLHPLLSFFVSAFPPYHCRRQ